MTIDLNADLGEGAGTDQELLELVSSANISCGAHAGDPRLISATLTAAQARGVGVGAHPSFPDRENFGRVALPMTPESIRVSVAGQLAIFAGWAATVGAAVKHVKPHGALYNLAAGDRAVAGAIVQAICAANARWLLFAPAGSELEQAGLAAGLRVVAEFFADRNYLRDGSLVPRSHPQALIHDANEAAERVLEVLACGAVRSVDGREVPMRFGTICLHGDSPGAVASAQLLRERLLGASITIAAP